MGVVIGCGTRSRTRPSRTRSSRLRIRIRSHPMVMIHHSAANRFFQNWVNTPSRRHILRIQRRTHRSILIPLVLDLTSSPTTTLLDTEEDLSTSPTHPSTDFFERSNAPL